MQDKSSFNTHNNKFSSLNKEPIKGKVVKYEKLSSALKENIKRRKQAAKIKLESEN